MSNPEFINEFDLLYNNITSNQAPGLDNYEKSVFLTKAQLDIIKGYFSPYGNKSTVGYDGDSKRQIDFSTITRVHTTSANRYQYEPIDDSDNVLVSNDVQNGEGLYKQTDTISDINVRDAYEPALNSNGTYIIDSNGNNLYTKTTNTTSGFGDTLFDKHSNSKSVVMPTDVIAIINEQATVRRGNKEVILQGLPINYTEYTRLLSKPFKRPLKNQAWRIINQSSDSRADVIVGPEDELIDYSFRYIKHPKPIILEKLGNNISIDGLHEETPCELPKEIHQEILQRAVELARITFIGGRQNE